MNDLLVEVHIFGSRLYLDATGGMRREVRFVAVDLEFVLQVDPPPSLMLAVLLRAENFVVIVSQLVRRERETAASVVDRRL